MDDIAGQVVDSDPDRGQDDTKRLAELRRILAPYGGVLTDVELGGVQRGFNDVVQTLRSIEQGSADSGRKKIGFTWVNSWDSNAIAFELNSLPEIALFGGTATLLAAVALAVARSEQYAPDISGGETSITAFGAVAACFRRRWPEYADEPLPSAEVLFHPPSSEREYIASDLVWVGASLLMMHEAAHHRCGHMQVARRTLGAWGLFESSVTQPDMAMDEESALLSQAIEVDADLHSLSWTLSNLVSNATSSANGEEMTGQCIHNVIIMLGVVCSIFDYEQVDVLAFRRKEHPHPAVRFLYGIRGIVEWAEKRGISGKLIENATLHGISDLRWISNQFDWTLVDLSESRQLEIDYESRRLRQRAMALSDG